MLAAAIREPARAARGYPMAVEMSADRLKDRMDVRKNSPIRQLAFDI